MNDREGGERESGISVLIARQDDDDDDQSEVLNQSKNILFRILKVLFLIKQAPECL